ncbi:MAG: acyltransferase [Asgard group archaeon]|nr:acyltransferase [Asgard group archaeon]
MTDTVEQSSSKTFTELERRYDLDWLRVITIFIVFIYHCTKFFDSDPFNVKNNPIDFVNGPIQLSSYKLSANTSYLTAIGLPLFFIIAGMSMFYALGYLEKKEIKLRKYVLVRFIRLIVPFLIGIFTYVSLLVFLEWTNKGFISMSFFAFYPTYFRGIYGFGGAFSVFGHHLWFLFILFLFTSVKLPLFVYLRKEKFRSGFSKIASFFTKPATIYLLVIPIYIMEIIHSLYLIDIPRLGGWDFFSYIFFLFFGYLFAYDKQFRIALKKNFNLSIIFGILSAVALILMNIYAFDTIWLDPSFDYISVLFLLARIIFSWSCLIIILNLGDKFLNKKSKTVKTLNELVLPFYIIHFVVVSAVGFYIVQLEFLAISEYLLIFLISLVGIISLLLLIREFNVLRFIFGMRVKKEKSISRFFKKKKTSEDKLVSE